MDLAGNYHFQPRKMISCGIKIDIKCCTEALLSLGFGKLSVRMEIYVKVLIEGIDQRSSSQPLKNNERIAVQVVLNCLGFENQEIHLQ